MATELSKREIGLYASYGLNDEQDEEDTVERCRCHDEMDEQASLKLTETMSQRSVYEKSGK